jgi:hypothetical protein
MNRWTALQNECKSDDWQTFTDSLKLSLNVATLHIGNILLLILMDKSRTQEEA